jgi:predicted nucleic acid-binding protein
MTSSPVIADTGFWVALTNRSDTHHARAVAVLEGLARRLVTTWPVLTETCHILLRRGGAATQRRFVESWLKGSFDVHDLNAVTSRHKSARRSRHIPARAAVAEKRPEGLLSEGHFAADFGVRSGIFFGAGPTFGSR